MMKLKGVHTLIVAASLASATFIIHCHLADLFSPLVDSSYKVLFTVTVFPLILLHHLLCVFLHSLISFARAQPHALPAELQGNELLKNIPRCF